MNNTQQMIRYVEARVRQAIGDERGDVPGWVMITLMTAALVAIVWGLAAGWLTRIFNQAAATVTGPSAPPASGN